jgi:hypothetical protein
VFVQNDDVEIQARRADACGIVWLAGGIIVNNRRLPVVLGKGRSWINDHLARLGYALAGQDRQMEAAVEATRLLGRDRYNVHTCVHWTYRLGSSTEPPANAFQQAAQTETWSADSDVDSETWAAFEPGGFL